MLAQRADEVLRQLVALVDIPAHLADEPVLALGLGARLYMLLVVGVCHRLAVGQHLRLGYVADEHAVRVEVDVLRHLERNIGVDVVGQHRQAVSGAQRRD